MKAIILAAGYATRLYPLTENRPKPLLEIKGKPIVEYILKKVEEIKEIDEIFIVTNNKFFLHFEEWKQNFSFTKKITIVNDGTTSNEDRLGSLGDVQFAINQGRVDQDVMVISGDNLFEFSLKEMTNLFYRYQTSIVALYDVKNLEEAKFYGIVGINRNNRMIDFVEKPAQPKSTLASTGIYIYPKETLSVLKDFVNRFDNTDRAGNFLEYLHQIEDVYCFVSQKKWFDIGSFESLKKAEQEYQRRTILVTGGAGFIGSYVVLELLKRGDNVIVADNLNNYYEPQLKLDRLKQFKDQITFYKISVGDYEALQTVFVNHQFDKICHLAAQAGVRHSLENPFIYEESNVLGTLNILELMKKFGIKDLVYASSSSVYGGNEKVPFSVEDRVDEPISLYAATKKANELYAYTYHHLHGLNCFGLRFFTVYGPLGRPDMALYKFTKAILENQPIDVYNYGKMKRSFTYVTDVADAVIRSLERVQGYDVLNVGNSNTAELSYFIECIESILGKKAIKNLLPLQPGDVPVTFAEIEKTKQVLGWEPKIEIEQGIKLFANWYQEYHQKEQYPREQEEIR